ncbi:MAG: hypothetical protein IPI21_09630 [Propionivibrio sp.]|nr:hypothetical protein [Propionivibrio sp.]
MPFGATPAVMLVHSFSQTSEWFQDYAAFVSLLGGSAASEDSIVSVGVRSGISLHLAWVRGDVQYLSKQRAKKRLTRQSTRTLRDKAAQHR